MTSAKDIRRAYAKFHYAFMQEANKQIENPSPSPPLPVSSCYLKGFYQEFLPVVTDSSGEPATQEPGNRYNMWCIEKTVKQLIR